MRMLPSLGGLEAFEATARLGTVSSAAKELHLTQGAVSRQIIALENRLGVTLFARLSKRLILTDLGAAYYSEVQDGLEAIRSATSSLVASSGHAGVLTVATLPTFGASWLIPRLWKFRDQHPRIAITLVSRPEPFDFAFDRVDCAIHFGLPDWPGAQAEYLFNEAEMAVAAPELAARVKSVTDLLSLPLLRMSSRSFGWHEWLQSFGQTDITLKPTITVDSFAMAIEAVRSGLVAAVLPTFIIEEHLSSGAIAPILGHSVTSSSAYYFVRPTRRRNHFGVSAFSTWLKAEAKSAGMRLND